MDHVVHFEVPRKFPCGLQSLDWKAGPEKVMSVCSSPIRQVNGLGAEGMLAIGGVAQCPIEGESVGLLFTSHHVRLTVSVDMQAYSS